MRCPKCENDIFTRTGTFAEKTYICNICMSTHHHDKVTRMFIPEREESYLVRSDDQKWNTIKKRACTKYDRLIKVADFKGVAFFKGYIPLWRVMCDDDFITEANADMVYAWNYQGLSYGVYHRIVRQANEFDDITYMQLCTDVGGF